ncbi:hypothetical protein N9963_02675 [Crocinitomicaceae bacterium]|nr:hypothetical protein [Crocinitomicaceae bacterium]
MKKILFLALLVSSINVSALDRFVDPNLSSGNGTTLFTTIASAVTASVNGDRILIVSGIYNEPTLTLSKSLTLLSQTAGSIINYNGNIVIAGFPGMKLEVLGFDLGIYSVSSNVIAGGVANNRAKVSFIDSKMTNLSVNQYYYELNCARCTMSGATTFRFGNFVVSKTNDLTINDEPNSNNISDKILIAADTVTNILYYSNDDHKFVISNNLLKHIQILKWNTLTSTSNRISNNEFILNSEILIAKNPPNYNLIFTSNLFTSIPLFYNVNRLNNSCLDPYAGNWGQGICWGLSSCNVAGCISSLTNNSYSTTIAGFPTPSSSGFFQWTYNGIDLPCTIPSGGDPLVLTKTIGTTSIIDAGNPNNAYYDIDLTVNDRGRIGGPYSILNYNPSINPSNGKAFIFDLEMPTDLFPGQQVDINAKGYHKN